MARDKEAQLMTSGRSRYVIEIERLPGGENARRFDGHEHGAGVSFFLSHNRPGSGPELHRHPYEETFIVEDGNVRFTVGDETIDATAGDIVVVPAETPHKFVNAGTEPLRQINIHPVARMETEWLE
jgi:mannose-6-phosphate isomerase-like protein (cupin superfamily)